MATSTVYNRAFWNTMRGQQGNSAEMNEGMDSTGACIVPDDFNDTFIAALEKENLFRRLATIVRVNAPDGTIQATASTGTAAWTKEGVAIPESADTFIQFPLQSFKLASLTRLRQNFISDYAFDIEGYLRNEFARRFGRAEEAAFLGGDGVDLPCGILGDQGGGEVGITASEAGAITFDEVKKLFFSLKPEYRRNATWIMGDETSLYLRTLKDNAGRFLWRDCDETILGRPVVTSPYMPVMTAGAKPILFSDLSYYWIVERQRLTVKVLSELFIREGQVGFAAFERVDGRLIRTEAVKVLRMAE